MFGALYGDVIGSYYEVHCTKDYDFPFANESRFTDDSVMIAAVCQTILNDPSDIGLFDGKRRSFEYAAQYRRFYSLFPRAGFGQMFSEWAKDYFTMSIYHSGSDGLSVDESKPFGDKNLCADYKFFLLTYSN